MLLRILLSFLFVVTTSSAAMACSNPTGVEGEIIYNTDHKMMQFCDSTVWVAMGGGTDITAAALDELANVNAGTPTDGQVLKWDNANGEWIAANEAGVASFKIPDDASVCDGTTDGTIRYNSSKLQVCVNGTGWTDVAGSGVTNGKFVDGTDTNEAVYTTGNVGIGTTDPDQPLTVVGNTATTSLIISEASGLPAPLGAPGAVGQWTVNGSDMYYDAGNVSIGSTTPAGKLNIEGGGIYVQGPAVPLFFIESDVADGTPGKNWRVPLDGTSLRFDVDTEGDGDFSPYDTPLAMTAAGNVGIGTTTPTQARLQIQNEDDASTEPFRVFNDNGNRIAGFEVDSFGNGWLRIEQDDGDDIFVVEGSTGEVGIGVTNPGNMLDIVENDGSAVQLAVRNNSSGGRAGISIRHGDTSGVFNLQQMADGRAIIENFSSAEMQFYAKGTGGGYRYHTGDSNNLHLRLQNNGNICGTDSVFEACSSDERLKKNITDIEVSGLDGLMQLRPVTFEWNDIGVDQYNYNAQERRHGFIAQEVQEIFPEWVSEDDKGYLAVDDGNLRFVMLKAMRELKILNDNHASEIKLLREEIKALKSQITQ